MIEKNELGEGGDLLKLDYNYKIQYLVNNGYSYYKVNYLFINCIKRCQ